MKRKSYDWKEKNEIVGRRPYEICFSSKELIFEVEVR